MQNFKRFSDLCAPFLAIFATLYALGQFMSYDFDDEALGFVEKLNIFFVEENPNDIMSYVVLAVWLLLSFVIGMSFRRWTSLCLAVSLLPWLQILFMYEYDLLSSQPYLYLTLGIVHATGNFVEALICDRYETSRKAYRALNVMGIGVALLGFALWKRIGEISLLELEIEEIFELGFLDRVIYETENTVAPDIFLTLSSILAIGVFLSIVLQDVYFVDAIVSVGMLAYTVTRFFLGEICVFGVGTLLIIMLYSFGRLALALFEPMRNKKEKCGSISLSVSRIKGLILGEK